MRLEPVAWPRAGRSVCANLGDGARSLPRRRIHIDTSRPRSSGRSPSWRLLGDRLNPCPLTPDLWPLPPSMLHLQCETPARWLEQVDSDLPAILIDHAHCEKKAAGTALNLIFAYVENIELCREMTEIVNEELEHFHMVLDLL